MKIKLLTFVLVFFLILSSVPSKEKLTSFNIDIKQLTDEEKNMLYFLIKASESTNTVYLLHQDDMKNPHIFNPGDPDSIKYMKEDIKIYIKNNPNQKESILSPFTLIKKTEDSFNTTNYSEKYITDLKKISNYMEKASSYTSNKNLKDYFNIISSSILKNEYIEPIKVLTQLNNNKIGLILGPYSLNHESTRLLDKAFYSAIIYLVNPNDTKLLGEFLSHYPEFRETLSLEENSLVEILNQHPVIKIADIIFSAGEYNSSKYVSITLPDRNYLNIIKKTKKIIFKNLIKNNYELFIYPVANKIIDEKQSKHLNFKTFFYYKIINSLCHYFGPFFIDSEEKILTVKKALGEYFLPIEEIKTDTIGLLYSSYLSKKSVYKIDTNDSLYINYLAYILNGAVKSKLSSIIQINYLIENKIIENKNNCFYIDPRKIIPAMNLLYAKAIEIESTGNKKTAEEFIIKYKTLNENEKELIDLFPEFNLKFDFKTANEIKKQFSEKEENQVARN